MGKIIKKLLISILVSFAALYLLYLFALSPILNNKFTHIKIEHLLSKILKQETKIENLAFRFSPDFKTKITISSLTTKDNILNLKEAQAKITLLPFKLDKIDAQEIYFDKSKLKNSKSTSNFNFTKQPIINIKNGQIILDKDNKITLNDFSSNCIKDKCFYSFAIKIKSNYLKENLTIKSENNVYIENSKIYAKNFKIQFKNKTLNLDGILFSKNGFDFKLKGEKIPVQEIKDCFLFFMKQKNKGQKNFIENFSDFKGVADITLTFKNKSIDGNIVLNNFEAKFSKFLIPMSFNKATVYFKEDKINLKAQGYFGKENLYTDLYSENIFNQNRATKGSLTSTVGNKFAQTYIPECKILGKTKLKVNYYIHNRQPQVEYIAEINKGSDIFYKNMGLGYIEKDRKIYAKTHKKEENLFLKTLKYSYKDNNTDNEILSGDGLFIRKNNKYNLDFIEIKTDNYAPTIILSSLIKDLKGGEFSGKIRYNANLKQFIGNLNLRNSIFKDFKISNAAISANEKNIKINATGKYQEENFSALLNMKNNLSNIYINNLELYLEKYTIKRNKHSKKKSKINIEEKVRSTNLTIKKATLKLDELIFKQITLEKLRLDGFIENNIVYFSMPDINFANGTLGAQGIYDLLYHSSDIDFSAKEIDSNKASGMIFNLKNQFAGLANATMHAKTFNHLQFIDAEANFNILDGSLTKIGSTEFLIKNSKFKISDLINIDLNKMQALKSDIRGSFELKNNKIDNIEIFNQNKSLSLFAKGNYNLSDENACLQLWGKYDKNAQKGIRILFVPLSWITKAIFKNENSKEKYVNEINKIPNIQASKKAQEIFMVDIKGNLNNSKSIEVKLKNIK